MEIIACEYGGTMDLKQLRYFVTVAEEGTISAAAKRLYMSQPPLSTQMKLLENELGCSLFERGQKHIRLTETGKLLYDRAQNLLKMESSIRQDIEACSRNERDTIRLGVVSSVICTRAGEWISAFLAENSGVRFEIYESNTYSLLEKLRGDIIHAALVRTPFPEAEFAIHSLAKEKMNVVCPKNTISGEITMKLLSEQPLILYRRWENILRQTFSHMGLEPHYICLCDDARTAVDLAERNAGISFVPASAAGLVHPERADCFEITDCPIESEIVLVYKENTYFPESVKRFTEFLLNITGAAH